MSSYSLKAFLIVTVLGLTNGNRSCANCFNDCSTTGSCDSYGCKPGYYGIQCTSHCPGNCNDGLSNKPVCDQSSGTCINGCRKGFYGNRCDTECSSRCLNNICNMEDGICTQGCIQHQYGPRCMSHCNETCWNRTCDRNGICTSCINGYFGLFCESKCSPNCADSSCVMTHEGTSKCSSGCIPGWKGKNCDIPYNLDLKDDHNPLRRSPRDTSKPGCEKACPNCLPKRENGKCFMFCKAGFHGNLCNSTCSNTCLKENNVTICDHKTGMCGNCKIGHWGNMCNVECSSMCVNDTCTQNTGFCMKCNVTKRGKYCEETCSDLCLNQMCDRWNGSCTGGCIRRNYGANCSYTCSNNCEDSECILSRQGNPVCRGGCKDTYKGEYCGERCPVNCLKCRQLDGVCTTCQDGFEGETCAEKASSLMVKIFVPIAIGVIVIVVIIALLLLKKRGHVCKRNHEETNQNRDNDDQERASLALSANVKDERNTQNHSEDSDMKNQGGAERKHLLDESVAKEDAVPGRKTAEKTVDRSHLHHEGQEPRDIHIDTQIRSLPTCRNSTRHDGNRLGLLDDDIKELKQTLAELNKVETDKDHMNSLWIHLGYTDGNIPPLSEKTLYSMLQESPCLQGLETHQAIYKLILALRFAGMHLLAERLTRRHEVCLPHQFMDGVKKIEKLKLINEENEENNNIYQGI